MRHPERIEDYLEHIAEAVGRAMAYLEPIPDCASFQSNHQVQDAVVRNIEIVGEAAGRIHKMDAQFSAIHPELPWAEMRGMRNKVIHGYFDIEWTVVWSTVKQDLPRLKGQIETLLVQLRSADQSPLP